MVLIKFSSYPYQEFGAVEENKIHFPDSRQRQYLPGESRTAGRFKNQFWERDYLQIRHERSGQIITEDTRLLEKVFYSFRKALER